MLYFLVPVLFAFYIQGVLKFIGPNSGAKRLSGVHGQARVNVINSKVFLMNLMSFFIKKIELQSLHLV
jgi:hypothetical protein